MGSQDTPFSWGVHPPACASGAAVGVVFSDVTAVRRPAANSNRPLGGVGRQVACQSVVSGPDVRRAARMAPSTTVTRRVKRKAPRAFLKRTLKQKKPHLGLGRCCDLLVSPALSAFRPAGHDRPRSALPRGTAEGGRGARSKLPREGPAPPLIASRASR